MIMPAVSEGPSSSPLAVSVEIASTAGDPGHRWFWLDEGVEFGWASQSSVEDQPIVVGQADPLNYIASIVAALADEQPSHPGGLEHVDVESLPAFVGSVHAIVLVTTVRAPEPPAEPSSSDRLSLVIGSSGMVAIRTVVGEEAARFGARALTAGSFVHAAAELIYGPDWFETDWFAGPPVVGSALG